MRPLGIVTRNVETLQRKVHPAQQGESGSEIATTGLHGTSTTQGLKPDPSKVEAILNQSQRSAVSGQEQRWTFNFELLLLVLTSHFLLSFC